MFEILSQMFGSTAFEFIAVTSGLINVVLIVRRSIWNYPFGFLMVLLYGFIFWEARLYSDALLQVYFFFIQIYGLWCWLAGRAPDGRVIVERLPTTQYKWYSLILVGAWLALGGVMQTFTDAAFPFWDASIAVLSVVAQYLMARRFIESWVLWIVVDLLAITLFMARGLEPTAMLYTVFLILSSIGLRQWLRSYNRRPMGGAVA